MSVCRRRVLSKAGSSFPILIIAWIQRQPNSNPFAAATPPPLPLTYWNWQEAHTHAHANMHQQDNNCVRSITSSYTSNKVSGHNSPRRTHAIFRRRIIPATYPCDRRREIPAHF
eukprot:GHVU01172442.1.p2 GENE.GHVU01172442.1~~GHVU01172442.1.p2  ORF type:complete len:114 (+),score=7.59 GHVU01172442.1:173-514(+)